MFNEVHDQDVFSMSGAIESLCELESNNRQAIVQQRACERLDINAKVTIRPGNGSQRQSLMIEGLTGDVSDGGCRVLLPRPVMPGDVFWLSFDDAHVKIGSLFARCVRCRLVQEEAYEAGFRFFNDIDLRNAIVGQREP